MDLDSLCSMLGAAPRRPPLPRTLPPANPYGRDLQRIRPSTPLPTSPFPRPTSLSRGPSPALAPPQQQQQHSG